MVKLWNSCIAKWEDWLTLNKGGWSKSFMTMTMTIWSPRSGVRIYQIVTGVTSDVGLPSTHLVTSIVKHEMKFYWTWDYFSMMGLNLILVSKRGPYWQGTLREAAKYKGERRNQFRGKNAHGVNIKTLISRILVRSWKYIFCPVIISHTPN